MSTLQKTNIKDFFERAIRNTKLDIQREILLENIANKIAKTINEKEKVNLNFIGTHNSRRSQFAQVWAYFAMEYYGIHNGFSYSSGINTSTFYSSTLKALEFSGFKFSLEEFSHKNPKYIINYTNAKKELLCYSKTIDDSINQTPFIAITICRSADENCSLTQEATSRFNLPYKDPKWSDDEDNEKEIYLNTSTLIAGEMGVLFKKVKDFLS
ncbi:hypothetical protein AXE80_10705 [Wenyingzhuangia fucanilytica]|uniref:Arsenate reductase n=1 Tax=Wenyingzhuangia fucanilytica TaxID=1790137 RepID=A0A1B1Y7G1_9FLAO|nr:hypothetical protein [Wenyingzhuangia fucanilytica]ANW96713.1 hypothetical protein AXE80_10705 [Wenyingzhuangia fucanilytica]